MKNISELKNKGLKSSAWNFLNLLTNQLRNFIVTLILARLLTPADFGLVSMAMVLNAILDFFVDFGFSSAIIRKEKITEIETSTVFWLNIGIGGICTLLTFLCAPVFAWFYEMPQLENVVLVTSWSFFISSFGTLQTALFQRTLNFRAPFKARLISSIASGILGIILAICGFGVWALVFSNLLGWLLYSISIWMMSTWRPQFVFKLRDVSEMVSFGWKITLSTLINRVFKQMDTLIIGKIYSAASLGLFNRAQSLNLLVIDYSFSSIRSVMLPTLSKLQNDEEALRYSVLKLLNVISFLTFLFSGLVYVCADDLILLLYGSQWEGAIEIFRILGLFSISLCLHVVFDSVMTVANRMNMYLWSSVLRSSMLIFAIPFGIYYGLTAYVWAISIIGIIKLIPTLFTTRSCIGLPIRSQLTAIMRYVLPFLIPLVIWHFIMFQTEYHIVNILVKSLFFTVIYIMLNFIMRNEGYATCKGLIIQVINKKFKRNDKI